MGWETVTEGWGVTGADEVAAASAVVNWIEADFSGAPDYTPTAIYDSLTVHGSGEYSPSVDNSVQTRGSAQCTSWVIDMPADWVNDGSTMLMLRVTYISGTVGYNNYYTGLVLADNGGDMTTGVGISKGVALYYNGTSWLAYNVTRVGIAALSGNTSATCVMLFPEDLATGGGSAMAVRSGDNKSSAVSDTTGITGSTFKILAVVGAYNVGADPAGSARFKYEYAVVPVPSAA